MGPDLRLKRADAHLKGLEQELLAYIDRGPYRVSDNPRSEGEWSIVYIEEIREWPDPEWSVVVSEVVHNLRAALDNLVWQLVLLKGEEKPGEHNQFPIYTYRREINRERMTSMLKGVGADHAALIEKIQPCQGRGLDDAINGMRWGLDQLAGLSNFDKHRFLHAGFGVRKSGADVLTVLTSPPGQHVEIITRFGSIYEGAELMRFRPDNPDTEVYVEGRTPLDVVFGYLDVNVYWLAELRQRIAEVVELFRPDFPAE